MPEEARKPFQNLPARFLYSIAFAQLIYTPIPASLNGIIAPEPPLLPKDPADRARVRGLADIVACDIHPINNLRVLRYLTHQLGHDEAALGNWYNHWIAAGFEALEPLLARDLRTGPFCHGDLPGLADVTLVPQIVNAERYRLSLAPYPTLTRIYENCMRLDAFTAAHPNKQPDYEA